MQLCVVTAPNPLRQKGAWLYPAKTEDREVKEGREHQNSSLPQLKIRGEKPEADLLLLTLQLALMHHHPL